MPTLYEYFGLIILFYSNEHEPIHVHGKYQGHESKAQILFENGRFIKIEVLAVKGKRPSDKKELQKFIKVVENYRDDIVRKWVDFFVYNREVNPVHITKKI